MKLRIEKVNVKMKKYHNAKNMKNIKNTKKY